MHEDKLNHDERVRLECIAQAVALNAMSPISSKKASEIVITAGEFYKFISGEEVNTNG